MHIEASPMVVAIGPPRERASASGLLPSETLLLVLASLAAALAFASVLAMLLGRSWEGLEPETAYRLWMTAGLSLPATAAIAAGLWGRRFWRLRRKAPGLAALGALLVTAAGVGALVAADLELGQGADVRELVAAEGRVGPYGFSYRPQDRTIGVAGGIGPGFAEGLERQMRLHPNFSRIVISSHGGLVREALNAAALIERRGHVTVVARWQCDSACIVLLMAGDKRFAGRDIDLGFHAVAPLASSERPDSRRLVERQREAMTRYLLARRVPATILATADRIGPADLYRVPAATLKDLGVIDGLVDEELKILP